MGDVKHRRAKPLVKEEYLSSCRTAKLCIEVGKRLVKKEYLWLSYDRSAHCDSLALSTGKLSWLFVKLVGKTKDLRRRHNLFMDDEGIFLSEGKRERHVFVNRHMSVKSIVLEHHCYVALLCGHLGNVATVDGKRTGGYILESRNHTKGGRLSAAGRTDKNDKLALLDLEVKVEYRLYLVVVYFVNVFQA